MLNSHKLYQIAEINQITVYVHNTYINIFDCKALQNLPKTGFLV
jgi:hypothetical protein